MADVVWSASVSTTATGTYTTLGNLQNVSMVLGRNGVADQWRPSTCTLTGRLPGSLPSITINDFLKVTYTGLSGDYCFRISDVIITYDPVSAADTWTVTAEGNLAPIGRSVSNSATLSALQTFDAIRTLVTSSNVFIESPAGSGKSLVSAITLTNENPMQTMQELMTTEQGYLVDYDFPNWVKLYARGSQTAAATVTFTDDNTASTTYKAAYNEITFASLAENYVTGVVVNPVGLAQQTSGTETRSREFTTYDFTTTQAAQLASYIKVLLGQSSLVPASLTSNVKMWTGTNFLGLLYLGSQITIKLRGTTYNCVIEGLTINGNPEQTVVQVRLSPATAYGFLTLDDAVLGRLDNNSLGF